MRDADVLIAGGGPVGLTLSLLLADLGVSSLVVERRDGSTKLAKAHYLNPRTMEILASFGFAEEIYESGTPAENMSRFVWYTSLGGDAPTDRQQFFGLDAFGGGDLRARYESASAYRPGNLPQKYLEPRLARVAQERTTVLFGHELIALEQDDDGVIGTIAGPEGELSVSARYLIGADGGRTVGGLVGIDMQGPPPLAIANSIHFAADLSEYLQEDAALVRVITRGNPDGSILLSGMAPMGPDHWDRRCETWVINVMAPFGTPAADEVWDEAAAIDHIRDVLRLPELPVEVIGIAKWTIDAVIADRYREGRVLVAGDAAHRHPPTTGLGLNSGIGDAHNLAWKLAAVLRGQASDALLDTYEPERKPVAMRNLQWAMLTSSNHIASQSGWGVMPDAPPEINALMPLLAFMPGPDGDARLARLRTFLSTQRMECQALDVEMGYDYYDGGGVVQDGSAAPAHDAWGGTYVQTSRPGHRMPHARLGDTSTHELLRPGAFLLLSADERWCAAADATATRLGIDIVAHQLDRDEAADEWREGALLVRPDGHVGYRAQAPVDDPEGELERAALQILGRSEVPNAA